MPIRTWPLQHPLADLRREMDRLLTGFTGMGRGAWGAELRGQPAVNLWESGDALRLEMEVPGVKSENLDVSVVGDQLTVRVDRPEVTVEGETHHRRERPVGTFTRVLTLPVEVDADKVSAELRHGVLTLTLPKAEAAKPRKIQVNVG